MRSIKSPNYLARVPVTLSVKTTVGDVTFIIWRETFGPKVTPALPRNGPRGCDIPFCDKALPLGRRWSRSAWERGLCPSVCAGPGLAGPGLAGPGLPLCRSATWSALVPVCLGKRALPLGLCWSWSCWSWSAFVPLCHLVCAGPGLPLPLFHHLLAFQSCLSVS
jgi:hypothetical protein